MATAPVSQLPTPQPVSLEELQEFKLDEGRPTPVALDDLTKFSVTKEPEKGEPLTESDLEQLAVPGAASIKQRREQLEQMTPAEIVRAAAEARRNGDNSLERDYFDAYAIKVAADQAKPLGAKVAGSLWETLKAAPGAVKSLAEGAGTLAGLGVNLVSGNASMARDAGATIAAGADTGLTQAQEAGRKLFRGLYELLGGEQQIRNRFENDVTGAWREIESETGKGIVASSVVNQQGDNRAMGDGAPGEVNPEQVREISPFFDPTNIAQAGAGASAARVAGRGVAAATLETAAEAAAREASASAPSLASKIAGRTVSAVGDTVQGVSKIADSRPVRAAGAGAVALAMGADPGIAFASALLGANTRRFGLLDSTIGATGRGISRLGKKVETALTGNAGQLADSVARGAGAGVAYSTPFLLAADSDAERGGSIASSAAFGALGASVAHTLQLAGQLAPNIDPASVFNPAENKKLDASIQRPKAPAYGSTFDAENAASLGKLSNYGAAQFDTLVRFLNTVADRPVEVYFLPEDGLKRLGDSLGVQTDSAAGFALPTSDRYVVGINSDGRGIAAGHEPGHVVWDMLTDEQRAEYTEAQLKARGVQGLADAAAKYNELFNAGRDTKVDYFAGRPEPTFSQRVASELFAEEFSSYLNSLAVEQYGRGQSFVNTVKTALGAARERVTNTTTDKGVETGLGYDPSYEGRRLINKFTKELAGDKTLVPTPDKQAVQSSAASPVPPAAPVETSQAGTPVVPTGPLNPRPVASRITSRIPKGERQAEVRNADGMLIAENAVVIRDNGDGTIIAEYTDVDSGARMEGEFPVESFQSRVSPGKINPDKPIYPQSPITDESPVGVPVRPTPTTAEQTVVPRQTENVARPQADTAKAETPNVRVTRDQQTAVARPASKETIDANAKLIRAELAKPRAQRGAFETDYYSAKSNIEAPDQIVRELQRRAADAAEKEGVPNPLRAIYQKVTVPYLEIPSKSGAPRIFAMSLDKVIQNVDLLRGWLRLNPGVTDASAVLGYLNSPKLATDLRAYLDNQAHGYAGDGRAISLPADARGFEPRDANYKPTKLDDRSAQVINALMGMEQPMTESVGQAFAARVAQMNGLEVSKIGGVSETNPLRAAWRREGFNPRILNAVVEQLRLDRMTTPLTPRPDLHFPAGDTGLQRAGFMPRRDIASAREARGNEETRDIARAYIRDSQIQDDPHSGYAPLVEERMKRIADFYESAKHEPDNPAVQEAYRSLADETMQQYRYMERAGIKIEPYEGKGEPYKNSAEMMKDVRDNKHLWFLKTEGAFGEGADTSGNALLEPSGVVINGHELLINDVFRAVHDYFGHTADGFEFGPRGEFNAYLAHSRMFSDAAKPALAAETLAQNAWVNFGPHLRREDGTLPRAGDKDFVAIKDRRFADQKNTIVPADILDDVDTSSRPAPPSTVQGRRQAMKDTARFMPAPPVDSPEFKKWFGRSKVVDADGKPLVVYHGTAADFTKFRRRVGDVGMHFGTAGQANDRLSYLDRRVGAPSTGTNVVPVYLKIENPLRVPDVGAWNPTNMKWRLLEQFPGDAARIGSAHGNDGLNSSGKIREFLQSKGYDGIVYKNTGEVAGGEAFREKIDAAREEMIRDFGGPKSSFSVEDQQRDSYKKWSALEDDYRKFREENGEDSYIVFEPTQIKSATGNVGTYDSKNPDIRYMPAPGGPKQRKVEYLGAVNGDEVRIVPIPHGSDKFHDEVGLTRGDRFRYDPATRRVVWTDLRNEVEPMTRDIAQAKLEDKGFSVAGHEDWQGRRYATNFMPVTPGRKPEELKDNGRWWLSPDGLFHEVKNPLTHEDWAVRTESLPVDDGQFARAGSDKLYSKGWVRVTGAFGRDRLMAEAGGRPLSPRQKAALTDAALFLEKSRVEFDDGENFNTIWSQDDARFMPAAPVDSPEFKKWFGDSKVVDANGKPLAVYHGSVFGGISHASARVSYFTSDPAVANTYADPTSRLSGLVPTIQKVFLKVENPLEIDAGGRAWHDIPFTPSGSQWKVSHGRSTWTTEELANYAERTERDGIIIRNVVDDLGGTETDLAPADVYVTLGRPAQIKSAIGNVGTYDPKNPDIRYMPAPGGLVQLKAKKPLDGAVPDKTLKLVHYGNAGMKRVTTDRFGKSGLTPQSELAGEPRSYFYVAGEENRSDPVTSRGSVYEATVAGDRLYDGDKDPLDYSSMINRSKADSMLKDAGYAGIVRTGGRGKSTYRQVELFEPVAVRSLQPAFMPKRATLDDFTSDRLQGALKRPGWAIVTGTQEKFGDATDARNVEANAKLEAELKRRNLPYQVVKGSYKGVDQGKSFLVAGLSEESARRLGEKYGQESVLTNRGLVYADGSLVPARHRENAIGDDARKLDFYSELPDGTAFSVGLDFDRKSPPDARATSAYREVEEYLTPDERETMRRDTAADVLKVWDSLPDDAEFALAAKMGQVKVGWYSRAAVALRKMFGDDTPRFVGLLAATSPRQTVKDNLAMSLKIWNDWVGEGRPQDPTAIREIVERHAEMESRIPNSIRALRGEKLKDISATFTELDSDAQLSGYKVESFRRNLLGELSAVTNDIWMAYFSDVEQAIFGTKAGYTAMTARVRRVAEKLGMQPAEVQEAVWSFYKTLLDSSSVGQPVEKTLSELSAADIVKTPEFYDIIHEHPEIQAELVKAGVLSDSGLADLRDPEYARAREQAGSSPLADVVVPSVRGGRRVLERIAVRGQKIKDRELAGASVDDTSDENPF